MQLRSSPFIFAAVLLAGCNGIASDRTVVTGTGPDELLKLRSGPSLGFNIILGLPDGTALNRHGCVTELGQTWCEVSLADAPRVTGYVAADYLTPR
jgi:uncharacterized protein YraI